MSGTAELVERLRLPISESMFARKTDMLHALFEERSEAASTIERLERERDEAREMAAKFVRCGPDLTVNRNEVASVEWDRRLYANGSASWLVITMNSGKQYRLENGRGYYGGVDCCAIEKELTGA